MTQVSDIALEMRGRLRDLGERTRYDDPIILDAIKAALNERFLRDHNGFSMGAENRIAQIQMDSDFPAAPPLRADIVSRAVEITDRINERGSRPEVSEQSRESRNV